MRYLQIFNTKDSLFFKVPVIFEIEMLHMCSTFDVLLELNSYKYTWFAAVCLISKIAKVPMNHSFQPWSKKGGWIRNTDKSFFLCNKPWSQIFSNIQRQKIQFLWKDKTTDTAKNLDWNLTVFILYTQCIVYQWCFLRSSLLSTPTRVATKNFVFVISKKF